MVILDSLADPIKKALASQAEQNSKDNKSSDDNKSVSDGGGGGDAEPVVQGSRNIVLRLTALTD